MIEDYDDMLDVLDGDERADGRLDLPAAAVIAVQDHEGRVLYSEVHFSTHPVGGDRPIEEMADDNGMTVERCAAIIAAQACRLSHEIHRKSCQ